MVLSFGQQGAERGQNEVSPQIQPLAGVKRSGKHAGKMPALPGKEFCLVSKIYGLIPAPEAGLTCDTGLFP
jgi:hypothetical protein